MATKKPQTETIYKLELRQFLKKCYYLYLQFYEMGMISTTLYFTKTFHTNVQVVFMRTRTHLYYPVNIFFTLHCQGILTYHYIPLNL